jgi:hypothetical protein
MVFIYIYIISSYDIPELMVSIMNSCKNSFLNSPHCHIPGVGSAEADLAVSAIIVISVRD